MKRESTLTVQSEEPPKGYAGKRTTNHSPTSCLRAREGAHLHFDRGRGHSRPAALMDKNRTGPAENFVQKDDFEARQEALWRWAAERLTPWGELEEEDYDFSSWTEGASEELLSAGCLYEYARESQTFRSFLGTQTRAETGALLWTALDRVRERRHRTHSSCSERLGDVAR